MAKKTDSPRDRHASFPAFSNGLKSVQHADSSLDRSLNPFFKRTPNTDNPHAFRKNLSIVVGGVKYIPIIINVDLSLLRDRAHG